MLFFRIFSVLSAILYLGNVTYEPKDVGECLKVGPDHVLSAVSDLLKVLLATLMFTISSSKEAKILSLLLVIVVNHTELKKYFK